MIGRTRMRRWGSALSLVVGTLIPTRAEAGAAGPSADASNPSSPDRTGSQAIENMPQKANPVGPDDGDHLFGDLFGVRPALARWGVQVAASFVADWSYNARGGLRTRGEAFRHLFDASLTLDTEPQFGLKGGKAFADVQTFNGRNGSELLVGDYQGFSNIDAPGFTALYELWYEQTLLDGKLRVKVGKIDATNEFAFVEHGGKFLASPAGFSPTIVGFPTYPDPATGAVVFVSPVESFYVGAGVFDGATQAGRPTGTRGPATLFGDPADLFLIAEAGAKWSLAGGRAGRLGVGVARHTGTFDVPGGGGRTRDGATSAYLVLDQTLAKEEPGQARDGQAGEGRAADGRGVGAYLQVAATEREASAADLHVGAGVVWTGPIPTRDADAVGLMASCVHFGSPARSSGAVADDYELAVELFYKVRVAPGVSVKPDVQYIVNPGGTGRPDALVGTLRLELAF
jgi:porin